jgi:hypothetical protein
MYLVQGDPGTGKTTLAMQFLMEGRRRGESCLYVTLSETIRELRAVAVSHGWSLDGIELFQLAAADSPAAQDDYTLYHPSEVELSETVKAMLGSVERARPTRVAPTPCPKCLLARILRTGGKPGAEGAFAGVPASCRCWTTPKTATFSCKAVARRDRAVAD